MKIKSYLCLLPAAGLVAFTACKSTPSMTNRPDFLSTYSYLQKVDDTTWRYLNPVLLGECKKFMVSPVKVMINTMSGEPTTPEQRERAATFVRSTIISSLSGYPLVTEPGPDVGEIRVAITGAYRTGGKLGLCVQGEILDNSNTQVAAVVRTELYQQYSADWQDKPSAREMVQEWGKRLRKAIDDTRR